MRAFLLTACLVICVAFPATAQVSITKSPSGWELANGHIRLELARSSDTVLMKSLRRDGGTEWAVAWHAAGCQSRPVRHPVPLFGRCHY